MSEWREVNLGEVADILVGHPFESSKFTTDPLDIRLLRGANVHQGFTDWGQEAKWPARLPFDSRYELAEGDVVLAMDRPWIEAGLKRTRLGSHDLPALLVQRVARLRGTSAASTSFIHHVLATEHFSWYLRSQATGSTVPHISQKQIASYPFRLPPPKVQNRICGALDSFDDLIENNRRRVELLEEMARAIYREWFVKFRYPGHEDVPLVDSALGPLPDGWDVSNCGRELNFVGGGTPSKAEPSYWEGGSVAWYTPTDLTKSRWRYAASPKLAITQQAVAKSSARVFPAGSVMMTSRATLGVLAIATTDATTNQGFIVVLPDARWSPGFMREWLDANASELAALGTGATFKEITKSSFKTFPFVIPPREVLAAHRKATEPLEEHIRVLEQQVQSLSSLRDRLLPKLVTGQIDVSSLDLDALVEEALA